MDETEVQTNSGSAAVELISHEGWAEIVLNRPERKNAITGPLGLALAGAIGRAGADPVVQVVLLRGAGGSFCSGLDIKEFNAEPKPDWLAEFGSIWRGAHRALFNCPVPVVVALERYAINGGAALALAADILIAGHESFLQVGEAQQGMAAPYNVAWLRLRHSENVTAQFALLARRYTGRELATMGVAAESVADELVINRATEVAEQLAGYSSGALRKVKATMRAYGPQDADAWFDRATGVQGVGGRSPQRQDSVR